MLLYLVCIGYVGKTTRRHGLFPCSSPNAVSTKITSKQLIVKRYYYKFMRFTIFFKKF